MKRTTRILSFLLVLVLCLSVLPLSAAAAGPSGWTKGDQGEWYYYQNGLPVSGWKKISNVWYYFDPGNNCAMVIGKHEIDGKLYAFNSKGAMQTGWWYIGFEDEIPSRQGYGYFTSNGGVENGWKKIDGKWYYFDNFLVYTGGLREIDGKLYYFNKNSKGGSLYTGWLELQYDGETFWAYFTSNGAVEEGWKKIGGVWYYFYDFAMVSDAWVEYNGDFYYFKPNGAMAASQWVSYSDVDEEGNPYTEWYYQLSSGKSAMGWLKLGGVWYYFIPEYDGLMATGGPWSIGGKLYYFKNSGALYTGWMQIDGKWMYFTSSGAYVNTTKTINGKSYKFDENGYMV